MFILVLFTIAEQISNYKQYIVALKEAGGRGA